MENLFLAKTKDHETIQQHTDKLLKRYEQLKEAYPEIPNLNWELLRYACVYHDLGKMNVKFQNKLIKKLNEEGASYGLLPDAWENKKEIPHGHLSVAFLEKEKLQNYFKEQEIKILYQAIYYHHAREDSSMQDRRQLIQGELAQYVKAFKYREVEIEKLHSNYSKYIAERIGRINCPGQTDFVNQFILIKGLLNKIDYAASGDIAIEVQAEPLQQKVITFFKEGGFTPNALQQYMLEHKEHHNIIIASTGIGKTEAALLWMDQTKGFFTLPLKVSINAIYDRIIDKVKYSKQKIALLHSDTRLEYMKREGEVLDSEKFNLTKQLSMPLTICTLDQLIDFVFKCEGYELKLAILSYSKLVIDEIQMYSPEMLAYLILALKEIHLMGGKFSIFTATLPPIFIDLLSYQIPDYCFAPQTFLKKDEKGEVICRHAIEVHEKGLSIKDITTHYGSKRILVIVNTVRTAQALYDQLEKTEYKDVHLLHSRFTREDRGKKEGQILAAGKVDTAPTLWISTQIVEASLDIDFDILYTELSELTGLFQRMGRVFRGRGLQTEEANVHIYVGEKTSDINGVGTVIDKDIFEKSRQRLLDMPKGRLTEEMKMELIEEVYSKKSLRGTDYYKKIQNTIEEFEHTCEYELDKREVKLRDIQTQMVIPGPVYQQQEKEIDNCIRKIKQTSKLSEKIKLKEEILNYVVTVPIIEYNRAHSKGFVAQELQVDEYTFIPVLDYAYTEAKGLARHNENLEGFCEETQFC